MFKWIFRVTSDQALRARDNGRVVTPLRRPLRASCHQIDSKLHRDPDEAVDGRIRQRLRTQTGIGQSGDRKFGKYDHVWLVAGCDLDRQRLDPRQVGLDIPDRGKLRDRHP